MISVGKLRLENPFILAPMAGIGDPPFRRLCRRGGAGLVCAEMVSSNALFFKDEKSERMLRVFPDEHPVSMQVFGAEPERLALAARRAEEAGADIVDLNCGCPVPKIAKSGAGVSLMENETLFARCLEAMVKAVKIPVTVKMRLGTLKGRNNSTRFARTAESVGVGAVAIHARSKEDKHLGPPNLEALRETVAAVRIPVFGNGGINTYEQAREMIRGVGCAGVMMGQAAIGNPLLFMEFMAAARRDGLVDGPAGPDPSLPKNRFDLLREHIRLNVEYYGEDLGVRRLRKFIASYVKGFFGAADFRGRAYTARTVEELERIIAEYDKDLGGGRAAA